MRRERAWWMLPWTWASFAVLVLAWGAGAPEAFAADESCATVSARAPNELLLPTADEQPAPLAVSIAAGETLCITGTIGLDGAFEPRLTDAARAELPLLRIRLERTPRGPVLRLRNSSASVVRYQVAEVSGPANLATPEMRGLALPGTEAMARFGPSTRRLLVYSLNLRPPERPIHFVSERVAMVFVSGLAEVRRLSATAFDAPLRSSGYGALPPTFPGLGGVIGVDWLRWRFELSGFFGGTSTGPAPGGSRIGASLGEGRLDAGYEFLRWRGLRGFALGGLGASTFSIDARGTNWTYIADHASNLGTAGSVEQDAVSLGLQAGFEQFVRFGTVDAVDGVGLLVSLRGGYSGQIADQGWATSGCDSRSVGGLPAVNTSGSWVSLNVGFATELTGWKPISP